MTDVMSAEKRSALMSRIKGKNSSPELLVRRLLWRAGLRFRLHVRELPGRPDIVLPRWHVAVFVHGCFWHLHKECRYSQLPTTRPDFWKNKLEANRERDLRNTSALLASGWRVAVVWECAVRADATMSVQLLQEWIRSGGTMLEVRGGQAGLSTHP